MQATKTFKILRVWKLTPSLSSITKRFCHESSSNDSSDEKKIKTKDELKIKKKEDAKQRMSELLKSLNKIDSFSYSPEVKLSRPQPKAKRRSRLAFESISDNREFDFSLKKAVKNVAKHLGGDVDETESELMKSLQSHSSPKRNLSELLAEMKISKHPQKSRAPFDDDTEHSGEPRSRLYEFKFNRNRKSYYMGSAHDIDIFGAPPLDIFPKDQLLQKETESTLHIWDAAWEREKKISIDHSPRNYFEEMILWTDQGKIWTFPIDNEVGLEEEKSCTFADHIFLEKHLEGWCPQKGPIRIFMELVCVGLSKNPYITVKRKQAHIEWYKNFFENKREILEKIGAL